MDGRCGVTRVGTSGWAYRSWEGDFYPSDLPRRDQLRHVAGRLGAVEVNATFYRLQTPTAFRTWQAQVPPDFRFAVKGSRYITHMKRLLDVETALANFLASGPLLLGRQLGPVLWQLPARVRFDAEVLDRFLALLPTTRAQASDLARAHDERVRDPWTRVDSDGPIRHVLEPRHLSFAGAEAAEVLEQHGCGMVVADSGDVFPQMPPVRATQMYVRLHGAGQLYTSRYSDEALAGWAATTRAWASAGADVDVYFDNDAAGHAPHDAVRLQALLAEPG